MLSLQFSPAAGFRDNSIKARCWHFLLNLLLLLLRRATAFHANPVPCQLLAADRLQNIENSVLQNFSHKVVQNLTNITVAMPCQLKGSWRHGTLTQSMVPRVEAQAAAS